MTLKQELEKKKNRCFKSAIISAAVTFLGVISVVVDSYFIGKVPKPEIYQTYQNAKRVFYCLDDARNGLERISDNNFSSTIQELDKMKGSLETNLKVLEEDPGLKQYNKNVNEYNDFSRKYTLPLIILGVSSMVFSGALYHRYQDRLDALKKQEV